MLCFSSRTFERSSLVHHSIVGIWFQGGAKVLSGRRNVANFAAILDEALRFVWRKTEEFESLADFALRGSFI
jgi:hypothetical protein